MERMKLEVGSIGCEVGSRKSKDEINNYTIERINEYRIVV